jgi:hypothetical protein
LSPQARLTYIERFLTTESFQDLSLAAMQIRNRGGLPSSKAIAQVCFLRFPLNFFVQVFISLTLKEISGG